MAPRTHQRQAARAQLAARRRVQMRTWPNMYENVIILLAMPYGRPARGNAPGFAYDAHPASSTEVQLTTLGSLPSGEMNGDPSCEGQGAPHEIRAPRHTLSMARA